MNVQQLLLDATDAVLTWELPEEDIAEAIKNHEYMLMTITHELRDKKPLPVPINGVWALDLTFVTDANQATHTCIGILDHGSRFCTRLTVLLNKRSWTLLGHLCLAIGKYGVSAR